MRMHRSLEALSDDLQMENVIIRFYLALCSCERIDRSRSLGALQGGPPSCNTTKATVLQHTQIRLSRHQSILPHEKKARQNLTITFSLCRLLDNAFNDLRMRSVTVTPSDQHSSWSDIAYCAWADSCRHYPTRMHQLARSHDQLSVVVPCRGKTADNK